MAVLTVATVSGITATVVGTVWFLAHISRCKSCAERARLQYNTEHPDSPLLSPDEAERALLSKR